MTYEEFFNECYDRFMLGSHWLTMEDAIFVVEGELENNEDWYYCLEDRDWVEKVAAELLEAVSW